MAFAYVSWAALDYFVPLVRTVEQRHKLFSHVCQIFDLRAKKYFVLLNPVVHVRLRVRVVESIFCVLSAYKSINF